MQKESPNSTQPAAHYDRVHRAWELIMGEEFHYGYFEPSSIDLAEATGALTEQMERRAAIVPGDRVLDVGCGTGHQSCEIAASHGATVLGITTSASGVEAATALAAQRSADARFEVRDGTDNGLADESFDVVWVLESSHLMRDRDALLRECVRVLAPGGRLVLCDIVRHRTIPFLEVRERRDDFATLRAAFGDAHMEPLDDYVTRLESLAVTVTDSTDITVETLPTFAAWRANVRAHDAALEDLIGQSGIDEFLRSCDILEAFWRDGTLGYGILAAVKHP